VQTLSPQPIREKAKANLVQNLEGMKAGHGS
jgi:hypothetical protein